MHLAGNTSLVLERFSSFSFLFLKLNFLSFFSSVSRGLWPSRIPSMQGRSQPPTDSGLGGGADGEPPEVLMGANGASR
ncbi:hypothetical protein EYF80_010148 [Liparis tanakae]|uniref:Uncharacterized protein n=1 Tax=Liparis tanakae TaxID=230148 RepID=A0A4Z2INX6_9TELE|nr:hypothetical protein EYF80_010148 [Liparis tanakae]